MTDLADVAVDDDLPPTSTTPERHQLFRYSAITWNTHRIHFDPEFARDVEGHPDALVQSHLHGALLQELVMDWLDADDRLRELSWRNEGRAVPGEELTARATVVDVDRDDGRVELEAWTETDDGRCAAGTATVELNATPGAE